MTQKDPGDRSTTFQPVQGEAAHTSGEVLLVSAYALLWALLLGWVALLWKRQRAIGARLDDLERVIDQAAGKDARPRR